MTKFIKKSEITSKWYEIDANNAVVGRLATVVSKILRGKNKATYTPHMDTGDFVIVKNIEKIKFTGSKFQNKKYYKHTGYPGGLKELYFKDIIKGAKPESIIKKAVERMMTSNALSKKQLSNLRIFKDNKHNLEAQKPEIFDFGILNRKNRVNS